MSRMSFKTRNLYYLRISEQSVLPVHVYLDERHLDWMSDQVLQHVLSDLRPRILPKLLGEAGNLANSTAAKTATVDTHRGDNYQFCYFLRRTEPHSVAIKTRNYVARTLPLVALPISTSAATTAATTQRPQRKRKMRSSSHPDRLLPSRSSKKQRNDGATTSDNPEDEEYFGSPGEETREMPSVNVDQDEVIDLSAVDNVEETSVPQDDTFDLPMEEEEEKPKPALQLNYKGFDIYGQCLCIVVEPWPLKHSTPHAPQELGGNSSVKSKQKRIVQSVPTTIARAQTPLFLADDNNDAQDDVRIQQNNSVINHWDDFEMQGDSDDDIESRGMMAFSQALNIAGDSRPGAVEDDNEMEGAVLFGDADEARQL